MATRHLVLKGFAEPDVARVRVVYRTKSSVQGDAAVDFFDIPNDVHRRIGSTKPADVFVAFLPRSVAAFDPARESNSLRVPAYDRRGKVLDSVWHTNLANAISRPIRRQARTPDRNVEEQPSARAR